MQTADFYSSATGTLRVNGGRDVNAPQGVSLSIDDLSYIKQGSRANDAEPVTDYDLLDNKPQINNITLTGNKSLNDLGIQPKIDSSHKVSADNIDDTDATNKFATTAQLAQITTNQNNILMLNKYSGGKNKYSVDATVTGDVHVDATKTSTGYQLSANGSWAHMDQEVILPSAGRYVISMTISNYNSVASTYAPSIIICPTSSISAPYLGSVIIEGNGEIVLTVETTNPVIYISYYINRSASETPTSSFEASNVMVCSESDWLISHDYQSYAMSNVEITAWILAHS